MVFGWKRWICLAWLCLIPFPGNAAAPMIAAGGNESLFLNSDGSVWGTGQIGNYYPGVTSPVRLLQLPNIVSVAGRNGTEFALLADGTVWGVGNNGFGALGDGTTQSRSQPQRVPGLPGVKAIAVSLALTQDGSVWAWGSNTYGQLGDGTQIDRYSPTHVTGLANVIAIAAGGGSALALRTDGTVWVWGFACCGSAGDGTSGNQNDPASNHLVPTQVHNLDQVIAISAGSNHHLALRSDRTVWTWGLSNLGQNGTGPGGHQLVPVQIPGLDHVVAIDASGFWFSLALKDDGTVWAWGNNNVGQLAMSGSNYSDIPVQVAGVTDIVAIAAGFQHVLAMRRDGTVLAWGGNEGGQLGDNTLQDRPQPLPVSGPGGTGQLNLLQPVPASINQLPIAQINQSTASGAAPLTVQFTSRNATDPDGTVRALYWKTSDGQQGSGQAATFVFAQAGTFAIDLLVVDNSGASSWAQASVLVSPATSVVVRANPKIGLASESTIALTNDGRIMTWGKNDALGLYDANAARSLPSANSLPLASGIAGAVDLVVGGGDDKHVLLADGTVLGWGQNWMGQIGNGSQASDLPQPQLLSGLPPVQALAAGFTHRLALTRDGRVFVWGGNASGQLGLGDTTDRFQPTEVPGLTGVTAVAAGSDFSAAVKADGTVWAWGVYSQLNLGNGNRISDRPIQIPGLANITRVFTSASALFAQTADGTAWVAGYIPFSLSENYIGPPPEARRIIQLDGALQIAGANAHLLALKADGTVLSGGFQQDLARGFPTGGYIPGLQPLPGISDAIGVAAGKESSAVLRRDGTVLTWGVNNVGQLGDGTLAYQQTPVLILNEMATGFLDLIPEVPNTIPRDKIPPFLLATYATGGLSSTTLYADLRGINPSGSFAASDFGRFAAGYNVYVAANVPTLAALPYFQLNANNSWSALNWPMAEYLRGVALDSQDAVVRAQILQNADLSSPQLAGASIIVGYGTDPDEMVRNARYRTIFTVPQQ